MTQMNPFYFGVHERQLLGLYEAAQGSKATRAVVLCHPWAAEYIHAYRAMRQLAKMLTVNGVHTLRFDYFGTGDSFGDMTAGDLSGWETDIQSAIEELKDITGAAQVSLVGVRLGATLAAKVAVRVGAVVKSLVLWDPVVSGVEYLTELHYAAQTGWLLRKSAVARPADQGGGHEIMGFPLTESLAARIRRIDLAALAPALPHRTLVVVSQPVRSHVTLQRVLDQRQTPLAIEHIDSPPAWVEWPLYHPRAGTLPVKILQRIVEWMA
jgi:pimeloyl-ACP methyl ester carboxylesterase